MKVEIKRLPDINSYTHLPDEYSEYGRMGLTFNGRFYVLGIHSSHPAYTKIGGYWAVDRNRETLYLSARGCAEGFGVFAKFIIEQGYIKDILNRTR